MRKLVVYLEMLRSNAVKKMSYPGNGKYIAVRCAYDGICMLSTNASDFDLLSFSVTTVI